PQITYTTLQEKDVQQSANHDVGPETGILNPILIEHTGVPSGTVQYQISRTDSDRNPGAEVLFPAGSESNTHSADCSGGYFLVGSGGSANFGSPEGTISLWIKWDETAPNGRFWGQNANFETRFSGNRLVLDWGSDNTLFGTKDDWTPNNWYFISIVWDQSLNFLRIYCGDEETEPVEDASLPTWTDSVVGLLTQNNIMNSRAYTYGQVDGHVDDFRYYNMARSLVDIRSDYNRSLSGTVDGLVHYYEFEDDLTDSAGSANLVPSGSYSFSIDVIAGEGGWRAEQIEVDIQELRILHALNGTFETGNSGTSVDWSGDATYYADGWRARREILDTRGYQRASYINTDPKYLGIENEGYEVTSPNGYRHYNGTKIYWYQNVDNSRLTEQFEFSMSYLYQRGPIGTSYSDIFKFSFVILNSSGPLWSWSIDPTNITQRGIWYNTNRIPFSIPDAPATFQIRISLEVNTTLGYVQISETDPDLNGDPTNGRFITLLIDDVSLEADQVPDPDAVDLTINIAPLGTIPISGSNGVGEITLNNSYWWKASSSLFFSSNSSISFEYSVSITKMTRFSNSTYSNNLQNEGVAYNVELDHVPEFSMYTYIKSYSEAKDIGIRVHYPHDWENLRVESPFGSDVSSQAMVEPGYLEIPSGVIDSVGWWKIIMDGINYADSIFTEIQVPSSLIWNAESEFYSGERIRCRASLGNGVHYIPNVSSVAFSWYAPSGSIWRNEIVGNSNGSAIVCNGGTFGPTNATIGIWMVTVSWTNGTEVAYGFANFELYHRLTVFAHTPNIEAQPGHEFTAFVYIYDHDNGNPILSDAYVIGNWSTNEVQFNPNLAKGWWEADFNTTATGTGNFVILVEVSLPFFESSNTEINIKIPDPESLYDITFRAGLVGAFLVIISFAAITVSRRFYMVSTAKRNLELLDLKGRIDDAKNLIGLLVIHRSIGLPVYSNILKGGFQESLLSSLISAISQFRSEFSMDEPTWAAIPITEVITAVQTEALICAIVTVESASNRQKSQLEAFGREVGGLYDKEDETIRKMVRTPTLNGSFYSIFDNHFDGQLMKRYVGVSKSLPKHLSVVSEALESMEIDHGVSVDAIIKSISVLGHSERRAYRCTLEAVDNGYLIAASAKLPSPIEPGD
ncbi:MAG: hypothetical protein ACFFDQ_10455, partial [Candidatus Thorarchaeota archaeon]